MISTVIFKYISEGDGIYNTGILTNMMCCKSILKLSMICPVILEMVFQKSLILYRDDMLAANSVLSYASTRIKETDNILANDL